MTTPQEAAPEPGTPLAESLGDALHAAAHPLHPWSGCTYPDVFYARQARFLAALQADPDAARAVVALLGGEGVTCSCEHLPGFGIDSAGCVMHGGQT